MPEVRQQPPDKEIRRLEGSAMLHPDESEKIKDNWEKVIDTNGDEVSPLDDDYEYWESQCESRNDPLSDDFIPDEYR